MRAEKKEEEESSIQKGKKEREKVLSKREVEHHISALLASHKHCVRFQEVSKQYLSFYPTVPIEVLWFLGTSWVSMRKIKGLEMTKRNLEGLFNSLSIFLEDSLQWQQGKQTLNHWIPRIQMPQFFHKEKAVNTISSLLRRSLPKLKYCLFPGS